MAVWRYMTDDEVVNLENRVTPALPTGDSVIHIFEVVDGWVCTLLPDGFVQDLAKKAPEGWFVSPVDGLIENCTYAVDTLRVKMNGHVVEMRPGTLVVFLPPNYRELADAEDRSTVAG